MSLGRGERAVLPPELPLYLFGATVAALAVAQLFVSRASPVPLAVQIGVPALFGCGATVYGGLRLRRSDRRARRGRDVLLVCGLLVVVAESVMVLFVVVHELRGASMLDPLFTQTITLAAAAVLGVPGGLYYDELVQKRRALREEVGRASALNQQLQVVNRVLRHNVRTELTVLGGHLEQVADSGAETDASIGECREALARLEELVEKVRHIEELGAAAGDERQDAAAVLTRAVIAARDRVAPTAEVTVDVPASAPVLAHPLLETAVSELVENALQHAGGPVAVSLSVESEVIVEVTDEGPGIPDHELAALERDHEAPLDHSSGVGLWLVNWVAEASDGELALEEPDDGGTVARLRLRRPEGNDS